MLVSTTACMRMKPPSANAHAVTASHTALAMPRPQCDGARSYAISAERLTVDTVCSPIVPASAPDAVSTIARRRIESGSVDSMLSNIGSRSSGERRFQLV